MNSSFVITSAILQDIALIPIPRMTSLKYGEIQSLSVICEEFKLC